MMRSVGTSKGVIPVPEKLASLNLHTLLPFTRSTLLPLFLRLRGVPFIGEMV